MLAELPRRERVVMRMVAEGAAQAEIAARLGCHDQRVFRLRARAVRRLRRAVGAWLKARGTEEGDRAEAGKLST